jgi:hypothetical protein
VVFVDSICWNGALLNLKCYYFLVLVQTFVKAAPKADRALGKIRNVNGTWTEYMS